jgi:hypothetical protein
VFLTFAVACIRIVTGFGPHEKRMIPPARTAATTADEVQLAAVPPPMTRLGRETSNARPATGTDTAAAPGPEPRGLDHAIGTADTANIKQPQAIPTRPRHDINRRVGADPTLILRLCFETTQPGPLRQPQVLYDSPDNLFVAGFMGSPAMNLYAATVSPDLNSLKLGSQTLALSDGLVSQRPALAAYAGKEIVAGIRPENLSLASDGAADERVLAVDTELVEALGSEQLLHFTIDAARLHAPGVDEERELGKAVAGIGVARIEPDGQINGRERVRLTVRTELMHFFDPETGVAIRS